MISWSTLASIKHSVDGTALSGRTTWCSVSLRSVFVMQGGRLHVSGVGDAVCSSPAADPQPVQANRCQLPEGAGGVRLRGHVQSGCAAGGRLRRPGGLHRAPVDGSAGAAERGSGALYPLCEVYKSGLWCQMGVWSLEGFRTCVCQCQTSEGNLHINVKTKKMFEF